VLCPLLTFSVTEYCVVTIWTLLVLAYARNKCETFLDALLQLCPGASNICGCLDLSGYSVLLEKGWGYAVAQLFEALRYKPEGRGFDSDRLI